ncbi:hypothetical protein JCM17823_08940 [Halorubrum gandharaense]
MSQRSIDDWSGDAAGEADECLSFELRGQWGHFRRVEGNIVKQTYRIPPRTTVAGIVAAILGLDRDSYYDTFAPDRSAVAIEPLTELRTMNMPQNTLSTAKEHMKTVPTRGHARVSMPDPTELRQQHNYEVLVDPAYRVDLQLSDGSLFDELRSRLESGTSHYPPSLGLSEHLAEVEYLGTHQVEPCERADVDVQSVVVEAVDDVELRPEAPVRVERSPGFMETDGGGRTTTEFTSIAYSPEGEPVHVHDVETARVDGRRVMFS